MIEALGGERYRGKHLSSLPKFDHEIEANGLRLILMPHGLVDVSFQTTNHLIHINLGATENEIGCNTDKKQRRFVAANSLGYWPKDTLLKLKVANPAPSCILSIPDDLMQSWLDSAEVSHGERNLLQYHTPDSNVAAIGRSAIQRLVGTAFGAPAPDQLALENFALGVSGSIVAGLRKSPSEREEVMASWPSRVKRRELINAVEWAELNITEQDLTITEMANIADLSPSHFSIVFKSEFGMSPYAFILGRRAQRALDLLIGSTIPLSHIAYLTGFSSQAHMTTIVKRFYKKTPAQIRR